MSQPSQRDIIAGQKIYHPWALKLYDFVVLWFSNKWAWRCTREQQLQHYQENISNKHLDVGVGTGYYLNKINFNTQTPQLTLMDLNQNCLNYCGQLLARYKPILYKHDIFQPMDDLNDHFDSIGLNYVLHCVPGSMEQKKAIIQNLAKKLKSNGVLFGTTILGNSAPHNGLGKYLMSLYNRKKFFTNQNDSLEHLKTLLESVFQEVRLETVGVVALFSAQKPR